MPKNAIEAAMQKNVQRIIDPKEPRDLLQKIVDRLAPPLRESRRVEKRQIEANGKPTSWTSTQEIRREYRVDLFGSEFEVKEFVSHYKTSSNDKDGKPNFYIVQDGIYGNPVVSEIHNDRGICGSIIPTFWLNDNKIWVLTEVDGDATRLKGREVRRVTQASVDNPITGLILDKASIPDSTLTSLVPVAPDFVSKDGLSNPARIPEGNILVGYGVSTKAVPVEYMNTEFDSKDKLKLKAMLLSDFAAQAVNLTNEGAVFGALMKMVEKQEIGISVR